MLNGRPHGSIFVGQHVSTKIHQKCSIKVASCRHGLKLSRLIQRPELEANGGLRLHRQGSFVCGHWNVSPSGWLYIQYETFWRNSELHEQISLWCEFGNFFWHIISLKHPQIISFYSGSTIVESSKPSWWIIEFRLQKTHNLVRPHYEIIIMIIRHGKYSWLRSSRRPRQRAVYTANLIECHVQVRGLRPSSVPPSRLHWEYVSALAPLVDIAEVYRSSTRAKVVTKRAWLRKRRVWLDWWARNFLRIFLNVSS